MKSSLRRRNLLSAFAAGALAFPFLAPSEGRAAPGACKRVLFFYFPDGVVGPSANGEPSRWHPTGSEHAFTLPELLEPLAARKDDCVFFRGLSMGPTDSGSHPGGAKKLLTATDGGNGESIDQLLARTAGADAPFRHLYLGVQANIAGASGDKHISYPSPGQSVTPEDNPAATFELLFGQAPAGAAPDPRQVSVIDGVLDDMQRLRARAGPLDKAKLDLHLEALREVEKRIKEGGIDIGDACSGPPALDPDALTGDLYAPERFPLLLRAQLDVAVSALACGLTRVAVVQASHHTSELLMSRFAGTEMHDPSFDMRSHQASHYGASHDPGKREYAAFAAQRRWWVGQLAYVLDELAARPEGDGTMLDHSLVVCVSEVCDGNTHLHDDMPFILAGRGGGVVSSGRLLDAGGRRHADLWIALAHAMGQPIGSFGDVSAGPLPGVLS
jgi:hypothetical protein